MQVESDLAKGPPTSKGGSEAQRLLGHCLTQRKVPKLEGPPPTKDGKTLAFIRPRTLSGQSKSTVSDTLDSFTEETVAQLRTAVETIHRRGRGLRVIAPQYGEILFEKLYPGNTKSKEVLKRTIEEVERNLGLDKQKRKQILIRLGL
jgi:hypothetical protein